MSFFLTRKNYSSALKTIKCPLSYFLFPTISVEKEEL